RSAWVRAAVERLVEVAVVRRGRTRPVAADVGLYHVGNDPEAHGWIVDALRRRPGVVVLHDFVLHHLVAGLTIGRKDGHGYLAAMERDAGIPGRLLAHGVLDGRVSPPWETRPDEFPLAGEVLANATGLIVHSHYVAERACDACISLRSPTMGETSGSAIRALSLGRPLVVSDLGWFSELPDDVALKVPVGEDEIPALATALELLASSEPTQLAMSDAARVYVQREHDLGRVAENYAAALEEAA